MYYVLASGTQLSNTSGGGEPLQLLGIFNKKQAAVKLCKQAFREVFDLPCNASVRDWEADLQYVPNNTAYKLTRDWEEGEQWEQGAMYFIVQEGGVSTNMEVLLNNKYKQLLKK